MKSLPREFIPLHSSIFHIQQICGIVLLNFSHAYTLHFYRWPYRTPFVVLLSYGWSMDVTSIARWVSASYFCSNT